MKNAYILIGASGSGKSTVAQELINKNPDTAVFSLDVCRSIFFALYGKDDKDLSQEEYYRTAFDFCNEQKSTFDAFVADYWAAALKSTNVIVDNVNSTRKSRAKWVDGLRKNKFTITMIEVHTPLSVILARQNTRGDKKVPVEAVKTQFLRQESAMVGSECDKIILIDGTKPWRGL